jgi:hypothetical protein
MRYSLKNLYNLSEICVIRDPFSILLTLLLHKVLIE